MIRFNDPLWSYVEDMSDGGLKCKFCGHTFGAYTSITRIRWHLSGVKGHGVITCGQVPKDVQEAAFVATQAANKRQRTMPSSSNAEVGSENAILLRNIESKLMEDLDRTNWDLIDWDQIEWDNLLITESNNSISTSLQIRNNNVAEAAPSAALQPLFGKLMSKWKSRLFHVYEIINDAEEKAVKKKALKDWLGKLKYLAYDVEDIIDEFETEALRSKLKSAESQARMPTPTLIADHVQPSVTMYNGLQEIDARWEEIMKEKRDLGLDTNVEGRSKKSNKRVPSTSLVKEPKVYGREEAKNDLVELLMKSGPSNSPYSVIPIVGMGGVGKTTLAQVVYNDERLKFDYIAWVCVSDDFDIIRLTKTILRCWEVNDLDELQQQLKEKLYRKKFLIVLDDVWHHNYEDWTMLCGPFKAGAPGSRVIITTRVEDVSLRLSSGDAYRLKELPYDQCLRLFAHHALDAENFDPNPDLKGVGQKIVQRCKGLPLAAKIIGGLLRHKKELEDWEDVLNSEIWELSEGEDVILSALRLSYHHLPFYLKQCFTYCAIFPKDYEFEERELVLLWMAEGFLQKSETNKEVEDIGHAYFKDLLSRSFFQQCSGKKSLYVMHDLINDLARSVNGEMCFHLDEKKLSRVRSDAKVRHSSFSRHSYDTPQRFKVFLEMKDLRTLLALPISPSISPPFQLHGYYLSTNVLHDLVQTLKSLRVLSLAGYHGVRKLPSSIGVLNHLRYHDLSRTSIERLPKSLGELLNLQTLKLCGCKKLVQLPAWIGNLINLRHLDISDTHCLREISKLKNLRFLPKFIVGEGNGLGIQELARLPHLQRQLHIAGLDKVTNIQDAKLANLKDRKGFGELAFKWSDDFHDAQNESHEKQVLNSLQPHQSLEKLSIICYGGTEFPNWVREISFNKLVSLQLFNCYKLKVMAVENFLRLETLHIKNMLELELWSCSNALDEGATRKFPKLWELKLANCPKLVGKLPRCLPSLQQFQISSCPRLIDLPEMLPSLHELRVEDCHKVILKNVPNFTSLKTLKIKRISGLLSLHEALVQDLEALEDLVIEECNELKYLWRDGVDLDKLGKLKRLDISSCEQLLSLVQGGEGFLPSNLQMLSLLNCINLEKLPNRLHSLASLRELKIVGCVRLLSFPEGAGLPYTLENLVIYACFSLESLPDGIMTMTNGDNSNRCLLEELQIVCCPSLKSFPGGMLPTTLKKLLISGCETVESEYSFLQEIMQCNTSEMSDLELLWITGFSITCFPSGKFPTSLKALSIFECRKILSLPSLLNLSHLTQLNINSCNELVSLGDEELPLPNLISLCIHSCEKLRDLPNHMDSLLMLEISSCCSLVSLTKMGLPPKLMSLVVKNCENLRQPISEWRLKTLTSLKRLRIESTADLFDFPDDDGLLLPNSLTHLEIFNYKNLRSISRGIQHLSNLKELWINQCPKLHLLPKESFPASLGCVDIRGCPLLTEVCSKEREEIIYCSIPRIPQEIQLMTMTVIVTLTKN